MIEGSDIKAIEFGWLDSYGKAFTDKPQEVTMGLKRARAFVVRGELRDGGKPMLLGSRVEVRSLAPDTCQIMGSDGLYIVDGFAAGTCSIEARLGAMSTRVDVPVKPPIAIY